MGDVLTAGTEVLTARELEIRPAEHLARARLPEWGFIHTHFGFGYRFQAEPSPPFHDS